MTETLPRPPLPRPRARSPQARSPRRPDALRAGLPAAAWALAAGLVAVAVPVLVVWVSDSRTGAGAAAALRAVAQVWLVAHAAALDVPGGRLGLAPLGLLALPLALLWRAGRHAATAHTVGTLADAARLTAGVAGPYALGAALVGGAARTGGVQPVVLDTLLAPLVVAVVGAGAGVLRGAQLWPALLAQVPAGVRLLLPAAAGALAALLGAGALLAGGSLAVHGGRALELTRGVDAGLVGGFALLLLGVALLPNAVVWGACWLAGPGFAVGSGTSVSPLSASLGPVPALPLFAALPGGALPLWAGLLVFVVPLSAGAVAGRLLERRGGSLLDAALAGPGAGVLLALLAWLSGGPLGGGRLAAVGPSPWQVGLALAVAVSAGACGWLAVRRRLAARSQDTAA